VKNHFIFSLDETEQGSGRLNAEVAEADGSIGIDLEAILFLGAESEVCFDRSLHAAKAEHGFENEAAQWLFDESPGFDTELRMRSGAERVAESGFEMAGASAGRAMIVTTGETAGLYVQVKNAIERLGGIVDKSAAKALEHEEMFLFDETGGARLDSERGIGRR
jgi:hypothetical protein